MSDDPIKVRYCHSGYLACVLQGDHDKCIDCRVRWDLPQLPRRWKGRQSGCYYWNESNQRAEYCDRKEMKCAEHHKRFSRCGDCGTGSDLCPCGKDGWTCETHGIGKGRCVEHGKLKATCPHCPDGKAFCHHLNKKGRRQRKARCKECVGSELCKPHLRNKDRCKDCGGKEICKHDQWYYTCFECPGPGACKHKGSKYNCAECEGSQICGHDLRIDQCYKCGKYPQNFCQECKITYVDKSSYKPYCAPCYYFRNSNVVIPTRYLRKQNYLNEFLRERIALQPTLYDQRVDGGCSGRKPDWVYDMLTHIVIVECDEDAHRGYTCENKRLMQLFEDFGSRPLVMIRFNPDKYDKQSCFTYDSRNIIHAVPEVWDRRSELLAKHLTFHLENIPEKEVTVICLFYPEQEVPVIEM